MEIFKMHIVGREKEQTVIADCLASVRSEFLVLYGRRRVGKTFLIREYFNDAFSFYATGVANGNTREQLKAFNAALLQYGSTEKKIPADWFEAFERLCGVLEGSSVKRDPEFGKRVVFLDELPWMDTARSDFKTALDWFWNSYGSAKDDLLLIVCGSATSWIISNILTDTGGLYNRITRQLHLAPFTLKECEALLAFNGITLSRRQMIESYMIFGGIPYYLNLLNRRQSLAQNIDELCFSEHGQLRYEYERLFRSLFKKADRHIAIIKALAEKHSGMTRVELGEIGCIGNGDALTRALNELEQCGFIRKYKNFVKNKQGYYFQLIDPFTLFSLHFLQEPAFSSWLSYTGTPGYYSWCGNAFELVCLNHSPQIKSTLGISGVETMEYAWRSIQDEGGAQIDLLIDRRDGVINLCEMKYTLEPFAIDANYEDILIHKRELFREETGTKKALYVTLVSAEGLRQNSHSGVIQALIRGDDLFGS